MRVIAEVTEENLKTKFESTVCEKTINCPTFIPLKLEGKSILAKEKEAMDLDIRKANLLKQLPGRKDFNPHSQYFQKQKDEINRQLNKIVASPAFSKNVDTPFIEKLKKDILSANNLKDIEILEGKMASQEGGTSEDNRAYRSNKPNLFPSLGKSSEIGYMSLDRTRISAKGFRIGEHIHSLSLAPGEEIVIEHTCKYKKISEIEKEVEKDFRELFEENIETNVETEWNEKSSLDEEMKRASSFGGQVGGTIPIQVPINIGIEGKVSDDHSTTRKNAEEYSIKESNKVSKKKSNEIKKRHRVTIKSTDEMSVESKSKRVIKNPNTATSVSYHYFKIYQKYLLQQEQYGARLCWTPIIEKPGSHLANKLKRLKSEYIMDYVNKQDYPMPPVAPTTIYKKYWISGKKENVFENIPIIKVEIPPDHVEFEVIIPKNAVLTGNVGFEMFYSEPRNDYQLVVDWAKTTLSELPTDSDGNKLTNDRKRVKIVAELIEGKYRSLDALKIDAFAKVEIIEPSEENKALMEEYNNHLAQYKLEIAKMRNFYRVKAEENAENLQFEMIRNTRVENELVNNVIELIAPSLYNEGVEVEKLHQVFDFENIRYTLYPSWWNENGAKEFDALPDEHYLNASWGRVFLPIKEGFEDEFANLAFPARISPDQLAVKKLIGQIKEEQSNFIDSDGLPQSVAFGAPWELNLPTDGTHIEAVLGKTTAADELTGRRLQANLDLLENEVDNTTPPSDPS